MILKAARIALARALPGKILCPLVSVLTKGFGFIKRFNQKSKNFMKTFTANAPKPLNDAAQKVRATSGATT